MMLHSIPREKSWRHPDVPLWNKKEWNKKGKSLDGVKIEIWREGGRVVGLWESSSDGVQYIVHLYEYGGDGYKGRSTEILNREYGGRQSWGIWDQHFLTKRYPEDTP
jgi:hypothetical protein